MYTIPKNLLSTNNSKTIKGEKYNFTTYILYIAPHTQNSKGINLCPHASKGCMSACLYNSGMARISNIQKGRINKANYYTENRQLFLSQLDMEINIISHKHMINSENKIAIRLNGTSDIPYEKFIIRNGKNIFELYPNIQFYDYTKNPLRMVKSLPKNYHLTFSLSEDNFDISMDILQKGFNVAMVFENKLPQTYLGYTVINGDDTDLRFLDEKNVIVGLKYKRMTLKGSDNKKMIENNDFIIKI